MSNVIGRVVCWIWGHRRGRKLNATEGETPVTWSINRAREAYSKGHEIFVCPRCYAAWTRKTTKRKEKA